MECKEKNAGDEKKCAKELAALKECEKKALTKK